MLIVCNAIDERLQKVWYRLQRYEQERLDRSMSQIELDEACVERLEKLVGYLEAEASRSKRPTLIQRFGQCDKAPAPRCQLSKGHYGECIR